MNPTRRRLGASLLASAVVALPGLAPTHALAQGGGASAAASTRPVKLVVGAAPGGPSDFLARLMADALSAQRGGQAHVVENKPGASGSFAADAVAKAAPDAHTLLLSGPAATVNAPFVMARLAYDPVKDLTPVAVIGAGAFVLAVNAALPVRSAADLIAQARANPGALNYGSGGNGSSGHLAGEFFGQTVGVKMTHVPYKGDGPAVNDLLGGQIQVMFTAPNVALPHAKAGKLRILAVTSRERLAALPEVPTMIEAGLKNFEFLGWIMAFVPQGTPRPAVEALQAAWARARMQPALRNKLEELGMQPPERLAAPEAVAPFLAEERERMARLVKIAGIKPE
ncbi:tripartite tricarboxylate transporter substrate binding protein [Ideonella sp. DXS22W]|uniref:Tripartite tricarboxylate transporter substrate binding protein n=1 Tax=Pseudaquabacterium inlustre TaxID=2984192 RepID=A0ABU9CGP4_9BURK